MSSKHVITAGTDGTSGEVIGYADDLCHALVHIERLLGGRDHAGTGSDDYHPLTPATFHP